MIARLQGIVEKFSEYVIVTVSGVGYQVYVPDSTLSTLNNNSEALLHIYMHVREDAISLYGFATDMEKKVFQTLLEVSGVGPKLALSVLSTLSPDGAVKALLLGDAKKLTQVKGLGEKTAQRMILELKDRLKSWENKVGLDMVGQDEYYAPSDLVNGVASDLFGALTGLGYPSELASDMVRTVLKEKPEGSIEELLKLALRKIAMR
jgi:Holliday junction DNA helicase RuvA